MAIDKLIENKMKELETARKSKFQAEVQIKKLNSEIEGLNKIKKILDEHPDLNEFIQISAPEVV